MASQNTVTVISTDKDVYHKTGASWQATPDLAQWMAKNGLVTLAGNVAAEEQPTEEKQTSKRKNK